jgi:Zn-dependent protease
VASPRNALRNTLLLGRILGIRIGLHRTLLWLLGGIVLFVGLQETARILPVILIMIVVFSLVLLHELGHSLVARRFGIRVPEITLSPFGGVAWMEEIPEDSRIESLIAIAGPAVNLLLALAAMPLLFVPGVAPLAAQFVWINLVLGLFNLIPAFPMDGGRLLRALLARRYDWLTATEKAVRVGRTLAIVGGLVGLLKGIIAAPFLAFFVIVMGQREVFAMRARKLGTGFPLNAFAEAARRAREHHARHGGSGPFGFEAPGGVRPPSAFAAQGAQSDLRPKAKKGGFSAEEIAKLEGSHGRLRRDWREGGA